MAYLLDTNVVSELRKGNRCDATVREWFDALDDDDAYLSVLVVGEIERGIERIRKRDPKAATRLRRWLSSLCTQFESRILPVTLSIARTWGKMGAPNPIPTVDGLLAATAHTHGLILATRNVTHLESIDIECVNPFEGGG
ncbi:MAG: type II toxin-antitoxin system VapC family toxin [Myxococcales bacterium]|nr:MAG: type II toxin-antitoxin system VapC family toxin [Myxococcales bacterium]